MSDLRWEVAAGSGTAHLMDHDRPEPRRTGRQSECGRRPQRNERAWFSLSVSEPEALRALATYHYSLCADCKAMTRPAPSGEAAEPTTTDRGE